MAKVATSVKVVLQSGSTSTVLATWVWSKSNTDHYNIQWWYYTGNNDSKGKPIWLIGEETTVTRAQATYDAPSNAKQVRFRVKPVSKTHKVKKKKKKVSVAYWNADWSTYVKYNFSSNPPDTPSVPTVTMGKSDPTTVTKTDYSLTAEVDVYDSKAKQIEFYVVQDNDKKFTGGVVDVKTKHAAFSCTVTAGSEYKVRCRAISGDGEKSGWSEYSGGDNSVPAVPEGFTLIKAISDTEVRLEWTAIPTATSYTIEYAVSRGYFDSSPANVKSVTITGVEHAEITGLDSGQTWWFRIQAANDAGSSGYGYKKEFSIVLGKKPSAPTTWSLKSTVNIGEDAILYWVHNSEDGSSQVAAQVELTVNGSTQVIDVENSQEEDEKDKTSSLNVSTTSVSAGGTMYWRVRTKGVTGEFGDWSIQRSIKVYAPAGISFNDTIPDVLTSYPIHVSVTASPSEQKALRFFVSVIANEAYETVNYDGTSKWIAANEEIYAKNFYGDNNVLNISLTPSDLTLSNDVSYTLKISASMDSGMNPEQTAHFTVGWSDDTLEPDASIGYDEDTFSTYITPFCTCVGTVEANLLDSSGNAVLDSSSNAIFTLEHDVENRDVTMSVYRREFDGTFTPIAEGLPGSISTTVVDPHPALDMARYRIVAVSNTTGSIEYYDAPGYEIGEVAVIIQWDEEWSNFASDSGDDDQPPWTGSLLRLPYNIDVADSFSPDTALVEYIGRDHPVSYYGTQRGSTSTWNMEIERDDDETLYALRRLAIYRGDVYVREPSGSGYWANVKVSFSSRHCELTIPVTLNITRVEGGV